MIKVGQIYSHKIATGNIIICVTKVKHNNTYYCIKNDGTLAYRWKSSFRNYELISEYTTWQEAVNSEEFKE